jgi:hypothetical protein
MNSLGPAPIRTPAVDPNPKADIPTPAIWSRWFNQVQAFVNAFSGSNGVGNGANGNIQAPAVGTGSGPLNPSLVVAWAPVSSNGTKYWMPLCK